MTKCCGEERTTPFCPMCGAAIKGHGIETLLQHCQRSLGKAKKEMENRTSAGYERHIKTSQASVNKWQSWVDAIRELTGERPKM